MESRHANGQPTFLGYPGAPRRSAQLQLPVAEEEGKSDSPRASKSSALLEEPRHVSTAEKGSRVELESVGKARPAVGPFLYLDTLGISTLDRTLAMDLEKCAYKGIKAVVRASSANRSLIGF
ncbi:hypothetical protein KM043_004406 [Ampulex compressa]|nr:hypothetical protein KM043_004406 [Ampulex compressa]